MKDLKERCEKLRDDLWIPYKSDSRVGYDLGLIEAFALQVRNETLEEAAEIAEKFAIRLATSAATAEEHGRTNVASHRYSDSETSDAIMIKIRALKTPALDEGEK